MAHRRSGSVEPMRVGRIVVRGEFGASLTALLPDCEVATIANETHINAWVRDDAELFGVVEQLRALGAEIVSVSLDR